MIIAMNTPFKDVVRSVSYVKSFLDLSHFRHEAWYITLGPHFYLPNLHLPSVS
jgi:hypothetical protein